MNIPRINLQKQELPLQLVPGETKSIPFVGSYVGIILNDMTYDPVVSVDNGMSTTIRAGMGFPTKALSDDGKTLIEAVFSSVQFHNPSKTETMNIVYIVSLGTPTDTRSVVQGYLQMDLSAPALQTVAKLSVVAPADPENILPAEYSVLPANALVKERLVQNNGDNPIWWGDANTSPFLKRGIALNPGGAAIINCWGSVYFIAEGAASTLSVVNILKQV